MSLPRQRFLVLSLLPLLALVACEGDPNGLEWGVRFASDADRVRARFVEASILEGGCAGADIYWTEVPLVPGGSVEMPPNLGTGQYGFAGRARDENCNWFVAGCVEATLPSMEPIIVTLNPVTESAECPPSECSAGRCLSDDAGTPDAAMDAATDAPPTDSGMDSGMDSAPGDSSVTDSGRVDSGTVDSGTTDTGLTDSGTVDLQVDPRNCGTVGNTCEITEYCTGGSCECRPGMTELTTGVCTDLERDPLHCGAEGNACDSGSEITCRGGSCEDRCNTGQTDCSDSCIDINNDPRHCGACDDPCSPSQVCTSGTCTDYQGYSECSSCPCGACDGSPCCGYGGVTICLAGGSCPL